MYENQIVKIYLKDNHLLQALCSDGLFREVDINDLIVSYALYEPLKDKNLFNKAKLKANFIIEWNYDIDLFGDYIFENGKIIKNIESPTIPLIGFKIKQARLAKEMSQKKLAKLSGIEQSEISRLEKGLINPSIEYLEKITNILGLKINLI